MAVRLGAVRAIVAVVAAALVCVAARGQVARSQSGRELDANYQIGSGGLNNPVRLPSRFDSQLYVTGQVSGLWGYGGRIPYRAPDELGLELPSASLESFYRQSVGLEDVLGRRVQQPAPFYDRTTTVFGARDIVAGRTAPGMNIPRSSSAPPSVTQRLYEEATAAYRPLVRSVLPEGALTAPLPLPEGALPGDLRPGALPFGWRVTSGFQRPLDEETQGDSARIESDRRAEAFVDQRVDAEVDASRPRHVPPREAALPAERQIPAPQGTETPPRPEARQQRADESRTPAADERLLAPNEDVYLDLLLQMRRLQAGGLGPSELDDLARIRLRAELARPEGQQGLPAPPGAEGPGARPKRLVGVTEDRRIIIRGLAGTSSDRFNSYMNQGKDSLYVAAFHKAAEKFQLAMTIRPRNPLPRLGRGLAFFGAGEPLSAGINVRKAIQLFPPLMETRLDVNLMMAPDTFDRRLRELDGRVQEEGRQADPLLLVLGAYLHYSVADVRIARDYAELLLKVAPQDKLYRALATFIITGKRPAEQTEAGTQPAR